MGTYVTQFIPITVYLNIPDEVSLKSLKEALDRRREKKISAEDLAKMTKFVWRKNYFESDRGIYQ